MKILRPLPLAVTRPISLGLLLAWLATMAVLVNKSYLEASSTSLGADLARYGTSAEWRGVYYRGEKIGFTVSQTVPDGDGFQIQEDARLQMSLLGSISHARIRTSARVGGAFALRSFEFSLDPGTGAININGRVDGSRLTLTTTTSSGTRSEERVLSEPPMLALNLPRRLASAGLVTGRRYQWTIFDPATLGNAPIRIGVGSRELQRSMTYGRPIPAFRVEMEFAGLRTTSWITDTGEVLREESPMGLISVAESPRTARVMAVSDRGRTDLLESAAIVPTMRQRIDQPRDVRLMRIRLDGADLSSPDLQGVGQRLDGNVLEIVDPQQLKPGPADPDRTRYLRPEPLIESDAPEIVKESEAAVRHVVGSRARAEALTRYVNALLEKKPTISLPSAREVLRTKVGDCNEHTALYVAMARAAGIPARIAVGLVLVRGAFYYHAWPEVYLDEPDGRGLWLPVDPTLNEFPADGTHLRLARGGLDKQAAILPLVGRLKMTVLDVQLAPNSIPILAGRPVMDRTPLSIALPARAGNCWTLTEPSRRR
ncbi:MAG: hypothetical protein A3H96_15320 [Acidobacteria bacterium RIFCSPLOWO2_02_FULL_67_36]|nr:MAG: hypothetical protein A3H96_15320 [Acidobacteria bacterium RIFCSPLOWO2_02_FULL_67_36]